jgi:hypothetical protein
VGGIVAMPAYVTGEGEPYRPETLFWMGAEGAVLGHTVGKPGELLELASESLRGTIAQPMWGQPHAPDRVRIASPDLAEALRAGQPEIEVVCAPTPEIDAVFDAMRERMNDDAETEQSYLSPDVGVLPQPERDGPTAVVQTRQGASPWQNVVVSTPPSRRSRSCVAIS